VLRKIVPALVVVIALFLGGQPAGASFHLNAGQPLQLTTGDCTETFIYFQYGTNAVAQLNINSGGCLSGSGIQVWAYGASGPICSYINYPQTVNCTVTPEGVLQTWVTGTLVGGMWRMCWGTPAPGGCWHDWLELTV
jgi:hypothetical protein